MILRRIALAGLFPLLLGACGNMLSFNEGPQSSRTSSPTSSETTKEDELIAQARQEGQCRNCLVMIPTGTTNKLGNPTYKLVGLGPQKQPLYQGTVVTGRAHTQDQDRNVAGTESPAPFGVYGVEPTVRAPGSPEVGVGFIPVYAQFPTERTNLGFHHDPSFEKNNGEDGTAGCIATATRQGFYNLKKFVLEHQPQKLILSRT